MLTLRVDNNYMSALIYFMIPRLKFKIDYKKDVQTFFDFNNSAHYDNGRTLEWAFFKKFPFLKKYKHGNVLKIEKEEIIDFVKSFYNKEKQVMQNNMFVYQANWQKKEKNFYGLVEDLFPNNFWPKGKYIVYPTIWGMFPRFLEDMTFQVPYKYRNKKYVNVIIAHEMLHFIFYNYFYKKYPQYKEDKYNFLIWHISEIFNVIVQDSSNWLKLFEIKTMEYPEHSKIIKELKKIYYQNNNWQIDSLIKDIIQLVKKSNLIKR